MLLNRPPSEKNGKKFSFCGILFLLISKRLSYWSFVCVCVLHISVWLCVAQSCLTVWDLMDYGPLSMKFPRQEYWSWLLFPPPGDLPNLGVEPASPVSPVLAGQFFITASNINHYHYSKYLKTIPRFHEWRLKIYLRHLFLFIMLSVALESEKATSYTSFLWSFYWFLKIEAGKHKGKYLTICLQCASIGFFGSIHFAYPVSNIELHIQ